MIESKDNVVDLINKYENGELSFDEVVEFFQGLVNNGTVWHLQGSYGRTAARLIEEGYVKLKGGRYDQE